MTTTLTLQEALREKPAHVFIPDGYGGISCVGLDYDQNCAFINGDLADQYETIADLFDDEVVYRTIQDCAATFIET